MGYVPPPPSAIITLPRDATYEDMTSIREAWRTAYSTPVMILSEGVKYHPAPFASPRLWADRHLEALGYGLLASVGAFMGLIAWWIGA